MRHGLAVLAVTAVLLGTAAPAGAHAEVREADPPIDGTAPVGEDEIRITFISMDPAGPVAVDVLDGDGDSVVAGQPRVAGTAPTGTTVVVPVEPLAAGRHVVAWEAMSSDGDGLSTGTYEFMAEEGSGGGLGVWLLWIVALAVPAAILLRPRRNRRLPGQT